MKDLSELLKDSIGQEFYCILVGNCVLKEITIETVKLDSTEEEPVLYFYKQELFPGPIKINRFGHMVTCGTEGECIIFPSKYNRDWDSYIPKFPIDTPVMVSDNGFNWSLRYAANEKNKVYEGGLKSKDTACIVSYKHIIPVKDFNFENPVANIDCSENEVTMRSVLQRIKANHKLVTID